MQINTHFKIITHVDESIKLTPVIPESMGQGKTDSFQAKLPENHFALTDFYSFGVDWIPAAPPKVLFAPAQGLSWGIKTHPAVQGTFQQQVKDGEGRAALPPVLGTSLSCQKLCISLLSFCNAVFLVIHWKRSKTLFS